MSLSNRSEPINRQAYKFCPNVTQGWDDGLQTLLLNAQDKHKRILDVGCGNQGDLLREGPDIWGVDPNLGTLRFNGDGKDYGKIGLAVPQRSVAALAEELPFADESFDITLSTKAVGWYPRQINTRLALREMLRVTKKKSGYVTFNVGQEMTHDHLYDVLDELGSEGYKMMQDPEGIWYLILHPECEGVN